MVGLDDFADQGGVIVSVGYSAGQGADGSLPDLIERVVEQFNAACFRGDAGQCAAEAIFPHLPPSVIVERFFVRIVAAGAGSGWNPSTSRSLDARTTTNAKIPNAVVVFL